MITLKNITKTYGGSAQVQALKGINLTIEDGEIFGIIGKSGAGKSTLVRCINMLEKPTSGQVIIDDKDLTKMSESQLRAERKNIGMIFQHFNLLSSRTVAENIAFPLELIGASKDVIEKKVASLLDLVGLSDRAGNYPSQLSGGQKQRVGIATIVVITHEMAVVKEICHRVAVIESGVIKEMGRVVDIFTNPQSQTMKDFVTSIINMELPAGIKNLGVTNQPALDRNMLVRLRFKGAATNDPVVADVVRKFNVEVSVLYGNIDYIQDEPFGYLIVVIMGDMETQAKAFSYIKTLPIGSEVLGYVPRNN